MSYFQTIKRIVIDTNILFMVWYNLEGKCSKILNMANKGKIEIYAPDSVKVGVFRILGKYLSIEEVEDFLSDFEINWTERAIYERFLDKVKVKHKPDKPIEALSLALECGVLSADKHFNITKNKIDIDKLIGELSD